MGFRDNDTKMSFDKGTINLSINKTSTITMSNVYFLCGVTRNLLLVSNATSNGNVVEFHNNFAIIHHKTPSREVIMTTCPQMGHLYPLILMDHPPIKTNMVISRHEIKLTLL